MEIQVVVFCVVIPCSDAVRNLFTLKMEATWFLETLQSNIIIFME